MEDRGEILGCMVTRLAQLLSVDATTLTESTTFASLNMKSVHYSQLTTTLEDACDVEVPFMDFKRRATLGEAADFVVALING